MHVAVSVYALVPTSGKRAAAPGWLHSRSSRYPVTRQCGSWTSSPSHCVHGSAWRDACCMHMRNPCCDGPGA
eukprot:357554-Chlamydomonas_euryale.AAC.16